MERLAIVFVSALVVTVVAAGCGGKGGGAAGTGDEKGSLAFSITFPAPSRLVPGTTQHVDVTITNQSTGLATKIPISAPAPTDPNRTVRYTVDAIDPGAYFLKAEAFPSVGAAGPPHTHADPPLASVTEVLEVEAGEHTPFNATMTSTLDHFEIGGLAGFNQVYADGVDVREGTILTLIASDTTVANVVVTPKDAEDRTLLLGNTITVSASGDGVGFNSITGDSATGTLTIPQNVGSGGLKIDYKESGNAAPIKTVDVLLSFTNTAGLAVNVPQSRLTSVPATASRSMLRLKETNYRFGGQLFTGATYDSDVENVVKGGPLDNNDFQLSEVIDHSETFTPTAMVGVNSVAGQFIPLLARSGPGKRFETSGLTIDAISFAFGGEQDRPNVLINQIVDYAAASELGVGQPWAKQGQSLVVSSVIVEAKSPFGSSVAKYVLPASTFRWTPVSTASGADSKKGRLAAAVGTPSGGSVSFATIEGTGQYASQDIERTITVEFIGKLPGGGEHKFVPLLGATKQQVKVLLKASKGTGNGEIK